MLWIAINNLKQGEDGKREGKKNSIFLLSFFVVIKKKKEMKIEWNK